MGYKTIEWDRERLYDEIWQRPTRVVAAEYGLSDVGLAKICKKLKIPRPGLGYWRRKETGKALPPRPPLPALKAAIRLVSHIDTERKTVDEGLESEPGPPIVVTVGGFLTDPHPFVAEAKRGLAGAQPDQYLRVHSSILNLYVTRASLERSFLIMDAILKAAEEYGMKPKLIKQDYRTEFVVSVDGEQITFKLKEVVRGKQRELTKAEQQYKSVHGRLPWDAPHPVVYHSTGILTLEIEGFYGAQHQWKDGKRQRIEECLGEFIHGLRRAAENAKEVRKKQMEAQAREAEASRRRLKYQERVERLKRNAAGWEEAERIRAYLAAARRKVEERDGAVEEKSAFGRFFSWAAQYADSIDPTISPVASPDWLEE